VTADHPWRIVAVMVLAQTLALMDTTILNVAPETRGDPVRGLAASPTSPAWIVDSYSLALAAGSFADGALADRYGPRRIPIRRLVILTHFWWGSVFLLNLPVAALGAAGAIFLVPELRHAQHRKLDFPSGALTLLGPRLVYGVIRGGAPSGFSSDA
jgi:MFS family permease